MIHHHFKKVLLSTSCQNKATFPAALSFVNTPQGVRNSLPHGDSSSYTRDGEKSNHNHAAVSVLRSPPSICPERGFGHSPTCSPQHHPPRVPSSEQAPSRGGLSVPPGQRGRCMCRQRFAADLGALPSSTCTAAPSKAGEKEADPFKGCLFAPPAAKQSFLSIINCSSRVLAELHQHHGRGSDLQEQSPEFWRIPCSPPPRAHHEKPACGMQEAAEPFKPATGSFTETELQSNINLQHPGLNASDKERWSQGDDRDKLVAVAHPCVITTPCLGLLWDPATWETKEQDGPHRQIPSPNPRQHLFFFPPFRA